MIDDWTIVTHTDQTKSRYSLRHPLGIVLYDMSHRTDRPGRVLFCVECDLRLNPTKPIRASFPDVEFDSSNSRYLFLTEPDFVRIKLAAP